MKNCCLIFNPYSGKHSKSKIDFFISAMEKLGYKVDLKATKGINDATVLAKEAEKDPNYHLIVISGGDGTINEAINGFNTFTKPVSIIPLGSANVLACELGIYSVKDTINAIRAGKIIDAYVSQITNENSKRKFLLFAGVGFDGSIVEKIRFKGNALIKKLIFVVTGIKELLKKDKILLNVVINEEEIECYHILCCRTKKYAGNFIIANEAGLEKPYFQILCIKENSLIGFFKLFIYVLLKKGMPASNVYEFKANKLEIKGKKPVQIDGEFFGYAPVKISLTDKKAKLFSNC